MSLWTGAISTDWNDPANWTTDGVSTGVPDATKDAIFSALSLNPCTTGALPRNCKDLITVGYASVLTIGSTTAGIINIAGNLTVGSVAGHIVGAAFPTMVSVTGTLTVNPAFTIPKLAFAYNVGSGVQTITVANSFSAIEMKGVGAAGSQVQMNPSAGTMTIDIVSGGAIYGSAFRGSSMTVRLNGACSMGLGALGYAGSIPIQSQTGSTVTFITSITAFSLTSGATFDFSLGTLVPNGILVLLGSALTHTINLGLTNKFHTLSFLAGTNTTVTMQSDIRCTNSFAMSGTATFNGAFDIISDGNISGGTVGTTNRTIRVTGATTGTSTCSSIGLNGTTLDVACGSNAFTIASGATVTLFSGAGILYTSSGTWTTTGSIVSYNGAVINMNGSTNAFATISNTSGVGRILTLLSNVFVGSFTASANDALNGVGFSLNVSGTASLSIISGTATLRFVGSTLGSWTQGAGTTNSISSVVFDKSGGATLNIPNSFTYAGATGITYLAGNINHTATLTVGNMIFNTAGMSWNNITVSNGGTLTLSSLLTLGGTLTCSGNASFAGAAGATFARLVAATSAATLTWLSGNTYTCTTSMSVSGTNASPINFYASIVNGTKAIFTLNQGATQGNFFVNARDIDSSLGQTVWDALGTTAVLLRTINWNNGAKPKTRIGIYY
jgi:hypothetical protein